MPNFKKLLLVFAVISLALIIGKFFGQLYTVRQAQKEETELLKTTAGFHEIAQTLYGLKKLPEKLDETSTLESITIDDATRIITLRYRLNLIKTQNVDFSQTLLPRYCALRDKMQWLTDARATEMHLYYDKNQTLIGKLELNTETCSRIKN